MTLLLLVLLVLVVKVVVVVVLLLLVVLAVLVLVLNHTFPSESLGQILIKEEKSRVSKCLSKKCPIA